jgi:hypothetical protein
MRLGGGVLSNFCFGTYWKWSWMVVYYQLNTLVHTGYEAGLMCYELPTLVHSEYEAGQRCVFSFLLWYTPDNGAGWSSVSSFQLSYTLEWGCTDVSFQLLTLVHIECEAGQRCVISLLLWCILDMRLGGCVLSTSSSGICLIWSERRFAISFVHWNTLHTMLSRGVLLASYSWYTLDMRLCMASYSGTHLLQGWVVGFHQHHITENPVKTFLKIPRKSDFLSGKFLKR